MDILSYFFYGIGSGLRNLARIICSDFFYWQVTLVDMSHHILLETLPRESLPDLPLCLEETPMA
jgi:hypothetical protein